MTWVPILIGAWLVAAVVVALVIGRAVHMADVIEHTEDPSAARPDEAAAGTGSSGGSTAFALRPRKALDDDPAAIPHPHPSES